VSLNLIEGIEEEPMVRGLTVQLDETVLEALDRLAEKTRRSRDWHVCRAVQDYVAVAHGSWSKLKPALWRPIRAILPPMTKSLV
jgi:Ribbon-helix-helix protein, copG family